MIQLVLSSLPNVYFFLKLLWDAVGRDFLTHILLTDLLSSNDLLNVFWAYQDNPSKILQACQDHEFV